MIDAIAGAQREVRAIFWGLLVAAGIICRRKNWPILAFILALWSWICFFFRDPDRTPEDSDPNAILAPADGKITKIEPVVESRLFDGEAQRITIFLSLLDVHVQRSPYVGEVTLIEYQPGGFAPAYRSHADANEANLVGLKNPRGPLLVVQMAGILARRIVCWPRVGHRLARGERFGLIKFGSRVDLYLPLDATITVSPQQQVYGGRTVVAYWAPQPTDSANP